MSFLKALPVCGIFYLALAAPIDESHVHLPNSGQGTMNTLPPKLQTRNPQIPRPQQTPPPIPFQNKKCEQIYQNDDSELYDNVPYDPPTPKFPVPSYLFDQYPQEPAEVENISPPTPEEHIYEEILEPHKEDIYLELGNKKENIPSSAQVNPLYKTEKEKKNLDQDGYLIPSSRPDSKELIDSDGYLIPQYEKRPHK